MIPKDCKRLAEVDFPIAVVSKHAAREKSIRHGHPSTLHLWWARRPLASCRAVLLGLLLPDPCDPLCPEEFRTKAAKALLEAPGWNTPNRQKQVKTDGGLRRALLDFMGEVANWDVANDLRWVNVARELVKAAHPQDTPLVVDPFAGGGSIPLEALRLGCEAFASDLNPVACLILKVLLEDIPRHGPQMAEELRRVGGAIKNQAEAELAELYPRDPDGATPIAYLWARTVRCEAPNCGAEIPLARSFWLSKKANHKRALRYRIVSGQPPRVEFEVFEPKAEKDVPEGTVRRARATCPCCGAVLPPERVRAQLAERRGGADVVFDSHGNRLGDARMLAVVTLQPGVQGRHYRLPTGRDYEAVWKAQQRLKAILDEWERSGRKGLCPVPEEPLPPIGTLGFRVQRYGMLQWGDLFTARQKVALVTLARLVREVTAETQSTQSEAVREGMNMVVSRCASYLSSLCSWNLPGETLNQTYLRQALPVVWDFCEAFPLSESTGNYDGALEWVTKVFEAWTDSTTGQVQLADATAHPLPNAAATVWFTDPPYYDAVPYADLSDFFFVWLKRTLPGHPLLRDPFDPTNPLTPKAGEAVQNERSTTADGRPKDQAFYEDAMAKAFAEGRRVLTEDGVAAVVFAHKTTEGWEALLSGMIRAGWTITASWPLATERPGRLRACDSAALATSVHLVGRPRPANAPVGDWADVLRELPNRVGDWMERLQGEGIRGADLVFACIGPALQIFSRYRKVETPDGREVTLAEYLEKVWEVVGRAALEQVLGTAKARDGAAGALEEDARLTALFLWTLQTSNGAREQLGAQDEEPQDLEEDDEAEEETPVPQVKKGYALVFDVVRRFAQPLGIELSQWEGRIIQTEKGVVRLLPVSERAKQLFGQDGAQVVAQTLASRSVHDNQQSLFPDQNAKPASPTPSEHRGKKVSVEGSSLDLPSLGEEQGLTTLDRIHAAMHLQAGGHTNALRVLLKTEQERGPDFLRLANALSALYPSGSEEKRLLDAMLLAVPK